MHFNNVNLDQIRVFHHFNSLDDLLPHFRQKNSGKKNLNESEINQMEAFIDFLKGVLRIDSSSRWTPTMAMKHPFIKRDQFRGSFEPSREEEGNSAHETGEDTISEHSSSSQNSKDYKIGSCPSKILYP